MRTQTAKIGKPFYFFEPGVGRIETYPSVLSRRLHGGFEQVRLRVGKNVLIHIARSSKGNNFRAKEILAELYPIHPPVDPRDIVAPLIDPEENIIQFTIKRAHLIVAEFFSSHENPRLTVEHLSCTCHEDKIPVFLSAFPSYKIEEETNDLH